MAAFFRTWYNPGWETLPGTVLNWTQGLCSGLLIVTDP